MPRALFVMLVVAACDRPACDPPPAPAEQREEPQCMRNDDCVLLPAALTCCIECPPAPPFEAAPSWVLDGMLIENETECAEPRHLCPEIRCELVPATCIARAACIAGKCVALAEGCELPTT